MLIARGGIIWDTLYTFDSGSYLDEQAQSCGYCHVLAFKVNLHGQINIELLDQADSKVNELMYYNPVVFPLMWADETAELDDENEQLYIDEVVKPTRIVTAVASVFGIALGTLVLLMGVCLCWIG